MPAKTTISSCKNRKITKKTTNSNEFQMHAGQNLWGEIWRFREIGFVSWKPSISLHYPSSHSQASHRYPLFVVDVCRCSYILSKNKKNSMNQNEFVSDQILAFGCISNCWKPDNLAASKLLCTSAPSLALVPMFAMGTPRCGCLRSLGITATLSRINFLPPPKDELLEAQPSSLQRCH